MVASDFGVQLDVPHPEATPMRRSHAIPFAALAITLAPACHETSDWATAPGGQALETRAEHNNDRLPFLLEDVDNPCTAAIESIDFEGIIHGQGSQWDTHFKSHYNVTLTGTDADGVRYVANSTGNGKGETFGVAPEDVLISTEVVSQGGTPNFVTKIVLHFAKDGTINVEKGGEECRGRT
jgi:hypothetical protein